MSSGREGSDFSPPVVLPLVVLPLVVLPVILAPQALWMLSF